MPCLMSPLVPAFYNHILMLTLLYHFPLFLDCLNFHTFFVHLFSFNIILYLFILMCCLLGNNLLFIKKLNLIRILLVTNFINFGKLSCLRKTLECKTVSLHICFTSCSRWWKGVNHMAVHVDFRASYWRACLEFPVWKWRCNDFFVVVILWKIEGS